MDKSPTSEFLYYDFFEKSKELTDAELGRRFRAYLPVIKKWVDIILATGPNRQWYSPEHKGEFDALCELIGTMGEYP